jgi:hypothetical protein
VAVESGSAVGSPTGFGGVWFQGVGLGKGFDRRCGHVDFTIAILWCVLRTGHAHFSRNQDVGSPGDCGKLDADVNYYYFARCN